MVMTKKKIFSVDDNLINLVVFKSILEPYYDVFTAPSAAKMFELLTKIEPELILLDVEMPDLNGFEAAQILKTNLAYKHIPIIFLTSKNDIESEITGFELGAADYIYKPCSPALLLKRIETQLSLEENRKKIQELHASMQIRYLLDIREEDICSDGKYPWDLSYYFPQHG